MTHLYIELNTGLTEEVNSSIISKLYELAISGDLDETSDLKGRLHSTVAYRAQIEYLNTTFPDLYISADDFAIPFEDPNMLSHLLSLGIGSNGMITENLAAAATSVANGANTTVTKFNELKYFTNITSSKGGYNSTAVGNTKFYNWTALEEVDISNFTSIGHKGGGGWEETFSKCSSLKTVTASSNLDTIGYNAFFDCLNLETITGLTGTITISNAAFLNCKKLKQENFNNVIFHIDSGQGNRCFENCQLLTSLAFDGLATSLPESNFNGCSALVSVSGLSSVTSIGDAVFYQCLALSSIDIDFSNITSLGTSAFRKCKSLTGTIDLSSVSSYIPGGCFLECENITSVVLGNSITSITYDSFSGCSNLQHINIPSSCTAIGNNAFNLCRNLDETFDLSNITSLGGSAFYGCNKINISNFPRISIYSNSAFYGIENTTITIPKEVTSINGACFSNLLGLLSVTFELNSQLINIGYDVFSHCPLLQSVILPEGLTTIDNNCFNDCKKLHYLELPSTLTRLNSGQLIGMYNNSADDTIIVFKGTTPPDSNASYKSLFGQRILSTLYIYVPDASVQAYKAHTAFSLYADRIFGLSLLPQS